MIFKTFIKRLFPSSFDNEIYNLTPKDLIIRKSSNHGGFKFGLSLFTTSTTTCFRAKCLWEIIHE